MTVYLILYALPPGVTGEQAAILPEGSSFAIVAAAATEEDARTIAHLQGIEDDRITTVQVLLEA